MEPVVTTPVPASKAARVLRPRQALALQWMEVTLYRLRKSGAHAGASAQLAWDEQARQSPLARAIASAAGYVATEDFLLQACADGWALPSIDTLRANPDAKRQLWQELRRRRR